MGSKSERLKFIHWMIRKLGHGRSQCDLDPMLLGIYKGVVDPMLHCIYGL